MKEQSDFLDTPLSLYATALLVGVFLSGGDQQECEEHVDELEKLADTFGLRTVGKIVCPIKKIDSATFLGKGKLEEIRLFAHEAEADLLIFDDEISPHQQRNLEAVLKKPVIDRTELIIEVFAKSAHTREARLQVELAKVKYQFPRLKRLWTHLSRQVAGGGGYLKGEGEKQIELDRRILRKRVTRLQEEIEAVSAQRQTQRRARLRSSIPTFAIVGYTNAGKSTLLRELTQTDVLVEDRLFVTLDTTTRKYALPNRQEVLLIDTVGFIRKLPHMLVVAFRSTLEETLHTDILLHLIDVSSPHAEAQAAATLSVLKELGADKRPILTVLNKIDRCSTPSMLHKMRLQFPKTVAISAKTHEGFHHLTDMMIAELASLRRCVKLRIPQTHYGLVSEVMRAGKVLSLEYEDNDILIDVEIPAHLEPKVAQFMIL